MDLGFLENLELTTVPVNTRISGKATTPLVGDIRLHKSGRVVYSDNFRDKAGKKWLDIFFSSFWLQYPKDQPDVWFICINDSEKPTKADIKSEGTSVFVKSFFWENAAKSMGFNSELPFIELVISEEGVTVPIALLPKNVQRGNEKGKATYVKRDDITLNVLSLHESFLPETETETETETAMLENEESEEKFNGIITECDKEVNLND